MDKYGKLIFINGEILSDACVPVSSPGVQYGYGLFETILVYNKTAIMLEEHLDRMLLSASAIFLKVDMDRCRIVDSIYSYINATGFSNMVLKIMLIKNANGSSDMVFINRAVIYTSLQYEEGFSLKISSIRRSCSHISNMKTLNHLENCLAKQEAVAAGCDEAVMINIQGCVCEGSMSNIFFATRDRIYTPDVGCGLLPGIVRRLVIERLVPKIGAKLEEGRYTTEDLFMAEEVFITNSIIGVAPVSRIGGKSFDTASGEGVYSRIKKEYDSYLQRVANIS